jgi:hypothetical protein
MGVGGPGRWRCTNRRRMFPTVVGSPLIAWRAFLAAEPR